MKQPRNHYWRTTHEQEVLFDRGRQQLRNKKRHQCQRCGADKELDELCMFCGPEASAALDLGDIIGR